MARTKGAIGNLNRDMKEILFLAFERAGGVDYLVKQSAEEPKAFMALLGRIVPTQVAVSISHEFNLLDAMNEANNNAQRLNDASNTIDVTPGTPEPETPNDINAICNKTNYP